MNPALLESPRHDRLPPAMHHVHAGATGAAAIRDLDAAGDITCMEPATFRDAMRHLAASVMIITTRDADGQPAGMVASSVISVSMDPPSMLVAVNRDASLHPVLLQSKRFCVNLLGDHQHHLLAPFSQSALRAQRFRSDDWHDAWPSGAECLPWLAGAPAVVECAVDLSTDYGSHTLFVGRVLSVRCAPSRSSDDAPLVWLAGRRASLSRPA